MFYIISHVLRGELIYYVHDTFISLTSVRDCNTARTLRLAPITYRFHLIVSVLARNRGVRGLYTTAELSLAAKKILSC